MRKFCLLLLVLLQLASLATTVYFARTGDRYHTATCKSITSSRQAVELQTAVNAGLTPCLVCKPVDTTPVTYTPPNVPGAACVYFAGASTTGKTIYGDTPNTCAPVAFPVTAGDTITITASGLLRTNGSSPVNCQPAGDVNGLIQTNAGYENYGGSGITRGKAALRGQLEGVFTGASARPVVFPVGASSTVTVPTGAATLWLGVHVGSTWHNNTGGYTVTINAQHAGGLFNLRARSWSGAWVVQNASVIQSASPTAPAWYIIAVANYDQTAGTITITAPPSPMGWRGCWTTVNYTNITAAVTGSGYAVSLAPGKSLLLRYAVTPGRTSAAGARADCTVSATMGNSAAVQVNLTTIAR